MRVLLAILLGFAAPMLPAGDAWQKTLSVSGENLIYQDYPARSDSPRGSAIVLLESATQAPVGALAELAWTLPEHGWHTMAIQIHQGSGRVAEFNDRLKAIVSNAPAQAGKPLAIIVAGENARRVARAVIDKLLPRQVSALVLLDRPPFSNAEVQRNFHKLQLVVLDINNLANHSLQLNRQRKALAAQGGQEFYQQLTLPARPNWSAGPDPMGRRIIGWLNRNYQGV